MAWSAALSLASGAISSLFPSPAGGGAGGTTAAKKRRRRAKKKVGAYRRPRGIVINNKMVEMMITQAVMHSIAQGAK